MVKPLHCPSTCNLSLQLLSLITSLYGSCFQGDLNLISSVLVSYSNSLLPLNPLSASPTQWSNTRTIRRQITDELFECV